MQKTPTGHPVDTVLLATRQRHNVSGSTHWQCLKTEGFRFTGHASTTTPLGNADGCRNQHGAGGLFCRPAAIPPPLVLGREDQGVVDVVGYAFFFCIPRGRLRHSAAVELDSCDGALICAVARCTFARPRRVLIWHEEQSMARKTRSTSDDIADIEREIAGLMHDLENRVGRLNSLTRKGASHAASEASDYVSETLSDTAERLRNGAHAVTDEATQLGTDALAQDRRRGRAAPFAHACDRSGDRLPGWDGRPPPLASAPPCGSTTSWRRPLTEPPPSAAPRAVSRRTHPIRFARLCAVAADRVRGVPPLVLALEPHVGVVYARLILAGAFALVVGRDRARALARRASRRRRSPRRRRFTRRRRPHNARRNSRNSP